MNKKSIVEVKEEFEDKSRRNRTICASHSLDYIPTGGVGTGTFRSEAFQVSIRCTLGPTV
jgi:hypothetical protein